MAGPVPGGAPLRGSGTEVAPAVAVATYFILTAGLSILVIGVLSIVGWMFHLPALTTWVHGSMPMAPVTALLSITMGTSLLLCGTNKRASQCVPGLVLGALSLAFAVMVLALRALGIHLSIEHMGFQMPDELNGAPVGVTAPITAAGFAAASIGLLTQFVSGIDRRVRLIVALVGAVAIGSVGFASVLTTVLGYPIIAGPGRIPMAFSTSVVLLALACGLAAVGIRLSDRSSVRASSAHRSWRPLALAFITLVAITVFASYAYYRHEESQIEHEADTRLDGIRLIPSADAPVIAAKEAASGAEVRTRALPDSTWSLLSVTDDTSVKAALWKRLRWVVTFVGLFLVNAWAVLTLIGRDQRAARYRERAILAEALRVQAVRASELAARSPAVLYTLRMDGTNFVPTDMSANVERLLGYSVSEALDVDWYPTHLFPEDREAALAAPAALATMSELTNEFRFVRKDGSILWVSNRMAVTRREGGRPVEVTGAWHDITERRKAEHALRESEERLRVALDAANALLKEVHHRVKNNLQVISSLLRLERDRHSDVTVKSAMGEMQLRIQSMALLHETLYRSNDIAHVDLGRYLTELANQVFRSAAPSTGAVSLRLNLASVLVDMDHAIACGLLVNEVLSNCFKHGFPNGRAGTVTIDLLAVDGGLSYLLQISDDGVGLPADFAHRQTVSLGVHLIKVLAQQLKASLAIYGDAGTTFSLTFAPQVHVKSEYPS